MNDTTSRPAGFGNLLGKANQNPAPVPLSPKPAVIESQAEPEKAKALYSSSPLQNFKVGRFQFNKAVLTLDGADDIAEFKALLAKLPARERNQIKTISVALAESMVRPVEPSLTRLFDSSVGRQRESIAGTQTIGTEAIDAPTFTESKDDMNVPEEDGQGGPAGEGQEG